MKSVDNEADRLVVGVHMHVWYACIQYVGWLLLTRLFIWIWINCRMFSRIIWDFNRYHYIAQYIYIVMYHTGL